jgi:hypothetical protein
MEKPWQFTFPNHGAKEEPQPPKDVVTPEEIEQAKRVGCTVAELRALADETGAAYRIARDKARAAADRKSGRR